MMSPAYVLENGCGGGGFDILRDTLVVISGSVFVRFRALRLTSMQERS